MSNPTEPTTAQVESTGRSDVAAVQARALVKRYEDGGIRAVDGLDLDIAAGEFVAICGPSGCGKTTLLNLIAAIDKPDAGDLRVAGQSLSAMSAAESDAFRRQTIGLVFQLHNLLPSLTALENVQAPMLAARLAPGERLERARRLLERVGLGPRMDALPPKLSGGERQRVAVARSLANAPAILLADEPTGSLDSENGARLLELLSELQRDAGTTLIVVTHDREVASCADRVIQMRDGRVAAAVPSGRASGRAPDP